MAKRTRTDRYPDFTIRQDDAETWTMFHDAGIFAISVIGNPADGFAAELMTRQRDRYTDTVAWELAHNAFQGSVAACVTEVQRRMAIIDDSKRANAYDMSAPGRA
jgi:hypothetical protein